FAFTCSFYQSGNINDINGELTFENTRFAAKIDNAKILTAPVKQTTISIDDFAGTPPMLTVQGTADARAEEMTRYIKESPLLDGIGGFTRFVTLEGQGKLELGLKFPLGVKDQNKITGKYTLAKARAKVALGDKDKGVEISVLNGSVAFTESTVKSAGLAGIAYGNPVTVAINGAGADGVTVDYVARADVAQLADVLPFRMPQQVTGTGDFTGRVLSKAGATDVSIESTMAGIVSTLPVPLAKRADEERKLRVQFSNAGLATEKIRVTLAGNTVKGADNAETRIDARFQRRFDARGFSQGLFGGIASAGEAVSEAAVPEGIWLAGAMARLDFDAWREAIDGFYPAAAVAPPLAVASAGTDAAGARDESPIAGFDFKLGGLLAYGRPFKAMSLKGRHSARGWAMKVDSDEASGDFTWRPAAFNDRGLVRARLQRFVLADEAPTTTPSTPVELGKEPDFPAFDIVADKFTFKDKELGKLELRATPQGANWKIDQLNITAPQSTLEMQGLWLRMGDPQNPAAGKSRTTMSMKLHASNLNALFDQFGFGDYVKGGRASLDGQLSWPGHPSQFQTSLLSGNFSIEASDGRFAKIKPGAGKLLGLISLQSIPRRITLDFRDIFSEGFAFDKIAGDMKINNGVIYTDNFEIKGPAADIRMVGDVSLPNENQNLVMTVKPSLGEGVAIGAGVVLGPAIGAGVLLAQKMLQGASTYEYAVTGSWDNPQVDKIARQGAKGDAPAAGPPATTAANTAPTTAGNPTGNTAAAAQTPKKSP
ncbi:MAG: AsmA-like C-terminal region-containing protein, partial [Betaproteobacteria bacterium]